MKIGFFGAGNMANALASSIKSNFPEATVYVYSPGKISAKKLSDKISGIFISELSEMPLNLDWYFLAFKPQSLPNFSFNFSENSKVISILAGVRLSKLHATFGEIKIVRMMPNIPSVISAGANLFFVPDCFSDIEINNLKLISISFGSAFFLDNEDQVDVITPFSGSGPALILEFARIFESELISLIGSKIDSRDIVAQTFLGTSLLMKKSMLSFSEMRDQVISKKGVTYEAMKVLDDAGIEKIFHLAFISAYKRTIDLSNGVQ
jgi:pyrroline-5-carboxylate reductase